PVQAGDHNDASPSSGSAGPDPLRSPLVTEVAAVVIPARLQSSRLPRKVLADLHGAPLVQRTYEVAVRADVGPVTVLADDPEVFAAVEGFGGRILMTDPELESGTARIASVVDALDAGVIVNLQGDAPLTDPEVVARAAQ